MNTILLVASLKLRDLNVEPYLNLEGQAPQFQVQSTFFRGEGELGMPSVVVSQRILSNM